jgi:hypothetical protein
LNRFKHALSIRQRIVVPEPQNAPAVCREKVITLIVCWTVCMLAAIQLDYQSVLDRSEVRDVRTDRQLSAKFCAVKPAIAQ